MSSSPSAHTVVVTNRTFLLGLDYLTRKTMKSFEMSKLLPCARALASTLDVAPADVPVEGYYNEHPDLTVYFKLIRALQEQGAQHKSKVSGLTEYQRLCEFMAAPIFGEARWEDETMPEGRLLPVGRDPLSMALDSNKDDPARWTLPILVEAARNATLESDDISLVGLAARTGDEVVLTALRETVVLYADKTLITAMGPERSRYEWAVDEELAGRANLFIEIFNRLTGGAIPQAVPENAGAFYGGYEDNEINGRCVNLGKDITTLSPRYYHWAIRRRGEAFKVHEFWSENLWTTERYSREGEIAFPRS